MPNPIPINQIQFQNLNQQNSQGQNLYLKIIPCSQTLSGNEEQEVITVEKLQELLAFHQGKVLELTNQISQINNL